MQKIFVVTALLMSSFFLKAQTFNGTGGAVPGSSTVPTCFPLTVTGVGNIDDVVHGLSGVCLNMTHPVTFDVEILLKAPDGTTIPLSVQNAGVNFTNTCFSATATTSIKFSNASHTGTFIPEGYLGAVNDGQSADGTWNLCIQDRRNSGSSGSLLNWSLTFSNTPAPLPPAIPACANTLPPNSSCSNATAVCDFNGLCGNTSGSTIQDWPGSGLNGPCFGLENNSFLKFIASSTSATFTVWVPTNTHGNGGGIQMIFFSGTCGSGAVSSYGCYPHIFPYQSGSPLPTLITATGLTPGNTYYLMFDGFGGDAASFVIAANSGIDVINVTPAAPAICRGQNVSMTASGSDGSYSWSPAGGLNTTTGATVSASPVTTSTYTVSSVNSSGCSLTTDVTVTVSDPPVVNDPVAADTQRVCQNGTIHNLQVTAAPGSGTITQYQWYLSLTNSNNTGFAIPGATSSTYLPSTSNIGTLYFYCKVTNSNGCSDTSSIIGVLVVSAPLTTPAASATVQPTCLAPTGTIVVTAPAGASIKYSNGGAFQLSNTFSGLAPGSYNITATDTLKGCTSPVKVVVIDPIPTEAAPSASATVQPTCAVPTGTLTITAPLGANYEYSTGGPYQAGVVFSGLANGTTYNVTVRNLSTGCISNATQVTINPITGAPAAPAYNQVQPDCNTNTGSITITSPLGATLEYSIGGAYQSSILFTSLSAGSSYPLTVRDINTGCVSSPTTVTVNAIPAEAAPVASITTQPTCTVPTGSITISSPVGANYQYSAGGAYQAGTVLAGLAPGAHNITVKNLTTGCISPALPLTINAVPNEPVPAASVTVQPTCILPTGSVTVSAPVGANYEYSAGGAYQAGTVLAGLAPGTQNITVKNLTTGCISPALPLTINLVPTEPAPIASVTVQPTCILPTGTVTVSAPVGANYEYSAGGAYQAATVLSGLAPGTQNITVKNLTTGCISPALPLTINPVPTEPAPVASVTVQPTCATPTGTVTISAPLGTGYEYSIGGLFQAGTSFTGLTPGISYGVVVKNISTGCVSAPVSLTIGPISGTPAAPTLSPVVQPTCNVATGSVTVSAPIGANLEFSIGGVYQSSATFTGLTPGNYAITARNTATGCISAATSVTINVIPTEPAPVASVTTQPNCTVTTGTITVTAPAGANYEYSVGAAYQAGALFTGLTAGSTYNVTVKNLTTGCISVAVPLTVDPLPAIPAAPVVSTPSQPDCNTPFGTINVLSPLNAAYEYSAGGNYQSSVTFNTLTPGGTFAITVKDVTTGCISPATSVTVNNILPVDPPLVVSPVTYCQNATAGPLTATGTNLLWYTTNTGGAGSPAAPTPSTTTAGNTFYYVSQTLNGCESPRRAITVTVNVTSTAVAGFRYIPDTVCLNGINPVPAYDLGFTTGGSFTSSPAGLSINGSSGDISLSTTVAGTYNVTYNYPTTGCINGNSASARITLLPAVNTVTVFSYSSPVCKNAPLLLPQTASGFTTGGSFTSSNGLSINSSTGGVDPAASTPGQYQVAYRLSQVGCRPSSTNFSFITIVDTSSPVTKFTYSATDVCMSAGINPTTIKAANFSAGGSFSASPAGLNINATTGDINIGLSVPGVYKIVYAIPALACQLPGRDSVTFILRAYGNPVTDFSYFSPVCKGDDSAVAVKDIAFTGGGTFTSSAGLSINATSGVINLQQSLPGSYLVRYDVNQGICNPAGFGTAPIEILARPASPSGTSAGICGPGVVTLSAQALGTVSWYTDAGLLNQVNVGNSFSTFVNSTTPYFVTNTIGTCESEPAILNAVVSPVPATPFLGNDTSICPNDRLVLYPGPYNAYLWQDGSLNNSYTVTGSGLYKVIVSTGVGCEDSTSIQVTVLDNCGDILFPNAFTPEGTNKTFGALGNLFTVSDYHLRIYNRYGQTIFETADPTQRWDGTFKGKPVNSGTYVYMASYVYKNRLSKVQKGTVILIR